ncbi:MAG: AI-2E family transporter [Rhizobiaceae bacterium]|nr:AI-2E family transporter [Rhizobiaceae bacterium]MCV0407495.1 AI-2E family transporter [Rhizobiaceae bacterium]
MGSGRPDPSGNPPGSSAGPSFGFRLLAAAGLAIGVLGLWQLRQLVLLVFAAVLLAILIRGLADLLRLVVPVGRTSAFIVVGLMSVLAALAFSALLGAQLLGQLTQLWDRLIELGEPIEEALGIDDLQGWLAQLAEERLSQTSVLNRIVGLSSTAAGAVGNLVLVIVAAFFLGVQPALYRRGVLVLFPPRPRRLVARTLSRTGTGLRRWLLGQLVSMITVGIVTYAGLVALGVPSALALGLIAGVLEFIPILGPLLAAAPAIAIALSEGPELALWVAGLYLVIQQLEGNLIMPLIQQRAVWLPPALTLFAVLGFGILFGPLGVLFATPLTVVCMIAINVLWVERMSRIIGDS